MSRIENIDAPAAPLFQSFFIGGFECSTQRTRAGRRLDLIASTGHDRFAAADYKRLQSCGIRTARDGLRWHLIERAPGRFDFSSVLPAVRAARETNTQVIWDLCHYGWPDDIDVFKPEFVKRFAAFARRFAALLGDETDAAPFISPLNEISFLAWASGDVGYFYPYALRRGLELKTQLVRAAIAAMGEVWSVAPRARFVHADPVINVVADSTKPEEREVAEFHRLSQYEAWDMIAGRQWPQLGGDEKYLDIIGVNYYPHNQWIHNTAPFNPSHAINRSHPQYRLFRDLLREVYERYRRPVFVAETGEESERRAGWLRYIGGEARHAVRSGVPLEGVCLYPIVNHPGWDDDRHCHNGLWDYADENGAREIHQPLADELNRQRRLFGAGHAPPANEQARRGINLRSEELGAEPQTTIAS